MLIYLMVGLFLLFIAIYHDFDSAYIAAGKSKIAMTLACITFVLFYPIVILLALILKK